MVHIFHVLKLVTFIFFVEVLAERPRFSERALELDQDVPPREEDCPQWVVLRSVLAKLGITEPTPHLGGDITWKGCDVKGIDLALHETVNGTLDDEIGKLTGLQQLDLSYTKVTGDISSLQGLTQLHWLWLTKTKVAGDLSSLRGLTQLQGLLLRNTKVAGDLNSLQNITKLRQLKLCSTKVTGDLTSLQQLAQLQVLDLKNTKVTGDLASLQGLAKLQELYLDNTQVAGGVMSLQGLAQLKHFSVANTDVAGEEDCPQWPVLRSVLAKLGVAKPTPRLGGHVKWKACDVKGIDLKKIAAINGTLDGEIGKLNALQELDLSNIRVGGDISSLRGLTQLERLKMPNTTVTGDLNSLQNLTQLKMLDLGKTKVAGDLASLRGLTRLRELSLANTKVEGDLSSLQVLVKLRILNLDNTDVEGDKASLEGLLLWGLGIANTKVKGEEQCPQWLVLRSVLAKLGIAEITPLLGGRIRWSGCNVVEIRLHGDKAINGTLDHEIGQLNALRELDLRDTRVAGNLASLQNLTQLKRLNLGSTHVAGDLVGLQRFTQLQNLNLGYAKVTGDLASLQNLTQLKRLILRSTEVAGDLASLQGLTKLDWYILDNTDVIGDLRSLQGLVQVQYLNLYNTNVSGDLSSLQGLTQLKDLYLHNSKIAGDLSSLKGLTELQKLSLHDTEAAGDLASLQGLARLRRLYLGSTQVAGDLSSLQGLGQLQELWLRDIHIAGDLASLGGLTRLQKIDLDNTKVAGELTSLQNLKQVNELHLGYTSVGGDLATLLPWDHVTVIDLEQTHVTGRLSSKWRGRWSKLRSLKLSGSQVKFLPRPGELKESSLFTSDFAAKVILPQLTSLELNGCPLDGDVSDLLLPLYGSPALATIEAAACTLRGALTDMKMKNVNVDEVFYSDWNPPLAQSLKVLNLASTGITQIKGVPEQMQVLVLAENSALNLADGVLKAALTRGTFVDLQNVALSNTTEAADLLREGLIVKSDQVSSMSTEGGYQCHSIVSSTLQVSPEKFLPQELCRCSPGFEGEGVQCRKCGLDTFSEGNSSKCTPCPPGSIAGEGEATCRCTSGGEFLPDQTPACQCHAEHALSANLKGPSGNQTVTEICVACHDTHLMCPHQGMVLSFAPPAIGFARLRENDTAARQCLPPQDTRCNTTDSNGSNHLGCASGYGGVLCSDCEAGHYLTNKACKPCPTSDFTQQIWSVAAVAGGIGVLAVAFLMYTRLRRRMGDESTAEMSSVAAPFSAVGAFTEQVKQLAPMLLQTCQLWAVLAALMKNKAGRGSSKGWEIPFIEASQLSVDSLKGALNLQCAFNDGAFVRLASALMAPVAPVAALLCCLATEICYHGVGVASALKALTLFYVGGASGASKLLRCQEVDGEKGSLPKEFAFRKSVPHLLCYDSSLAYLDAIGYASVVFYGVVVPLCLAYLYARQHLALLPGKTTVARAVADGDEIKVRLVELDAVETSQEVHKGEVVHIRRLLAASAAHIAVKMHGRIRVTLKDGVVVAKRLSGDSRVPNERASEVFRSSIEHDWQLEDLSTLLESSGSMKSRDLTEALTDRCLLEEAESSQPSLAGAKHILFKYSRCQSFYIEIIQKLVAVGIVSVVNSDNGLELSLAIALLMAAASGMVQPYFHPQANILQCCSYLCLALAAVGFSYERTWLSRGALAVPFLLSAALAVRPDSTESLAVRIWRQMEKEISKLQDGKALEIQVETVSFI